MTKQIHKVFEFDTGKVVAPVDGALGDAITRGRDFATYLWQVPDDAETRAAIQQLLHAIRRESAQEGRREMPQICDELLTALSASPSPQQVDMLQDGFDRLYKLWSAAKSGMMPGLSRSR
jgi:hypothetical protein